LANKLTGLDYEAAVDITVTGRVYI